jgi:GNAT superfamily N-acetyltransferase
VDAEGGLVGFALGLASGDEYVIKWLAVARERHRHGVGKLLIGRLIETARSSSLKRLVVDTLAATHDYEPYARTRAFYEACGFTLERIERSCPAWVREGARSCPTRTNVSATERRRKRARPWFDEVGLVWRTFASTILMGFVPEGSS